MASNSKSPLLLLGIFVLFISNVSSYDEELVNQEKDAKAPLLAVVPTPSPPVKPSAPPSAPVGKEPTTSPTTGHPVVPAPQPPVNPPVVAPNPAPVAPIVRSNKDCLPLCENRCQLHSRKRVCIRACSTCCERCRCVPPGTYGNREVCGKCYTDMVTHGNQTKCP